MLSLINPAALPALRIAATFFLTVNILAFVYIFRNRHRFFDEDFPVCRACTMILNREESSTIRF
jgi:hypothetical protein